MLIQANILRVNERNHAGIVDIASFPTQKRDSWGSTSSREVRGISPLFSARNTCPCCCKKALANGCHQDRRSAVLPGQHENNVDVMNYSITEGFQDLQKNPTICVHAAWDSETTSILKYFFILLDSPSAKWE